MTPKPTRTVVATTRTYYATPCVWSREYLEGFGFNLTDQIPAILWAYDIPGFPYPAET